MSIVVQSSKLNVALFNMGSKKVYSRQKIAPPNSSSTKIELGSIYPTSIFSNLTKVPTFTISVKNNVNLANLWMHMCIRRAQPLKNKVTIYSLLMKKPRMVHDSELTSRYLNHQLHSFPLLG